MSSPFRKTDAVLTVAQDNVKRTIEVTAANDIASNLTGYSIEELRGHNFRELVPEKISEMLDDYVEFEPGANDVGDVLRKVRDFQLVSREGNVIHLRLKILRHPSQILDEYLLILQDEAGQKETDSFLTMLRENLNGHTSLNADTGLPDRSSIAKSLEMIPLHLERINNGVCFAVLELDQYDAILNKYGISSCHKTMQAMASICQQNLRGNDMVMQFDSNRLGLILIGANDQSAKMVLNRLRWLIAGHANSLPHGQEMQTSVTVVLKAIDAHSKPEELFSLFEKKLKEKPYDSSNLVIDA